MIYITEFEFYESDGCMLAVPFGIGGGTFGDDFFDAVSSAADWLSETINDQLMCGVEPARTKLGNSPQHGGRVIAVAVDCNLSHMDAVSAADAAKMLHVSTARIAQMCESGRLTSWREGSRRMVLRRSINTRLKESPKAGRPRKETATPPVC